MKVSNAAKSRYKKFHKRDVKRIGKVNLPVIKELVLIGPAIAVEYESDKPLSKKDKSGKKRIFRHKFGKGVKAYTDKKGKLLLILGANFRVTDWLRD